MMTFDEFHNGLRLLRSIDAHEVGDPHWYGEFQSAPYTFFIRCNDETAQIIWAAMVKRGAVKPLDDEKVRVAICCGKTQCNAAEWADDFDMSADGYAAQLGCESSEVYKQAREVIAALGGST